MSGLRMDQPIEMISSKRRMFVIATCTAIACAVLFSAFSIFDPAARYPLTAFVWVSISIFVFLMAVWLGWHQRKLVLSDTHFRIEFFSPRAPVDYAWSTLRSWGADKGNFILQFGNFKPRYIDAGILKTADRDTFEEFLESRFSTHRADLLYGVEGEAYLEKK